MFGSSGGFGSSSNTFGATNTGFGSTSNSSLFGSTNTNTQSAFGSNTQQSGGLFGSSTQQQNSWGGFGGNTSTQSSFGSPSGFNTGANTSSGGLFGGNTQQQGPINGTQGVNYQKTIVGGTSKESDFSYISMSAMPQFETAPNERTMEELRLLDYAQNGKINLNGFTFAPTAMPSSGGMFGSTQSTSLFGAPASNTATSGFGSTNTSGGLFGSTQPSSSGGMFGSTPSNTGGTFGNTSSGFGGFGSTTQNTSGGLFGSSTTTAPSGGLFGSTPATNTSTGGLFGSTNTTHNTFGSTSNIGGGLFGSAPATSAPSGGLFGSTTNIAPSGNLFGGTPNANQPASGGLFGNTGSTSGGLFGSKPATTGGLFGSSTTTNTNTGSLFGGTTTTSGGLFGNTTPAPAQNTGSLFGGTSSTFGTPTQNQNTGGGLFGNAGTTQSSGGLFGAKKSTGLFSSNTNTSGGLFGNSSFTTSTNNQTSGSLFGNTNTFNTGSTNNTLNTVPTQNTDQSEIMRLINLAGYSVGGSSLIKQQMQMAKRAWDPKYSDAIDEYGSKKFKFQLGVLSQKEMEPEKMQEKMKMLGPSVLQKKKTPSIGALVMRSAKKEKAPKEDKERLKLMYKLKEKFLINKNNRVLLEDQDYGREEKEKEKENNKVIENQMISFSDGFQKRSFSTKNGKNNVHAPVLSAKLKKQGYELVPSEEKLQQMSNEELQKVKDFEIRRPGFASVRFLGATDLSDLVIDEGLVEITSDSVEVYKNEEDTPPVGTALNKLAEITIYRVTVPPGFYGSIEEFSRFLEEDYTKKMGGSFVSFEFNEERKSGVWKFRVEHFTKYGLHDVEFEQEKEPERKKQRKREFVRRTAMFGVEIDGRNVKIAREMGKDYRENLVSVVAIFEEMEIRERWKFEEVVAVVGKLGKVQDDEMQYVFEVLEKIYGHIFRALSLHREKEEARVKETIQRVIDEEPLEPLCELFEVEKPMTVRELSVALERSNSTSSFVVALLNLIGDNMKTAMEELLEWFGEVSNLCLFSLVVVLEKMELFATKIKKESLCCVVRAMIGEVSSSEMAFDEVKALLYLLQFLGVQEREEISKRMLLRNLKNNAFSEEEIEGIKAMMSSVVFEKDPVFGVNLVEAVRKVANDAADFFCYSASQKEMRRIEKILLELIHGKHWGRFQSLIEKVFRAAIKNDDATLQRLCLSVFEKSFEEGLDFNGEESALPILETSCLLCLKLKTFDQETLNLADLWELSRMIDAFYEEASRAEEDNLLQMVKNRADSVVHNFSSVLNLMKSVQDPNSEAEKQGLIAAFRDNLKDQGRRLFCFS